MFEPDDRQKLFGLAVLPPGLDPEREPGFAEAHMNAYDLRCNWHFLPGGANHRAPAVPVLHIIDLSFRLNR